MSDRVLCGKCSKPKKADAFEDEAFCECGRPLKFESAEELAVSINLYFADCDSEYDTRKWAHDEIVKGLCQNCFQEEKTKGCMLMSGEVKRKRPYTTSGLAVWLDTSRQTLLDYEEKDEFADTVKAAKQRIENYAEERLFDPKTPTLGVKFSLTNNFKRWNEKVEQKVIVERDGAAALANSLLSDESGDI